MGIAQKLYHDGHITYMRTDSTLMSEEARGEARKQVESKYGLDYVSHTSKATLSNGAHECIRPTKFTTEVIGGDFGPLDIKIYNLIFIIYILQV
jgi:DNA topoisomerase-1